ncbi:1,4-dihydroxy-2-naphthoate octaprenyltransferase [Halobacteriales archaeon QS_8_69_26]|nr:MAG: 1,4-dihydroxy-2-naphthoate octaprenyltransferase [Halobacteriales archaeon QS_8_69_26]
MSRPSQLLLIGVVYATGVAAALARGVPAAADRIWGGLAAVVLVAAGVHYANEYADYGTDRLTDPTPFSGGSQALVGTDLHPRIALRAAVASLVLGAVFAAWRALQGHLGAAAGTTLGLIAVFGWTYSLPPLELAWRGWGELDNAALGGLALPVYGFAATAGRVDAAAVLAFVPFSCLVFLNLLETQWPDREADAAVGKYTLATRWDPRRLRRVYAAGTLFVFGSLAALLAAGVIPLLVGVATLPAAPLVAWGYLRYTRREFPFPAVAAMVLTAVGQLAAWPAVAGLVP